MMTYCGSDFVCVGFPKSGTTALIEQLAREPAVNIGMIKPNNYEADISKLTDLPEDFIVPGKINGHKNAVYIYSETAMRRIVESDALVIVCVRAPLRALVSWWAMHRRHAEMNIGMPSRTEDTRAFFRDCDIQSYWNRFAKHKMNYVERLSALADALPHERLLVIRQEDMARNIRRTVRRVAKRLGFRSRARARGKAQQRAIDGLTIPPKLAALLEREEEAISEFIALHSPDVRQKGARWPFAQF